MIKEGIIPPFSEEGFDPNDKSTYFNEEEYIKKIGVNIENNNYLLPSEVYSSIFDQRISTLSFKAAIEINSEFFEDKKMIVINIGIGLYNLLCSRVGAKKVYSFEPDNLIMKSSKLISFRNFMLLSSIGLPILLKYIFKRSPKFPLEGINTLYSIPFAVFKLI